jgi:hypothetical protein
MHRHPRTVPTCVNAEVLKGELEVGDVWSPLLAAKHLLVAVEGIKECPMSKPDVQASCTKRVNGAIIGAFGACNSSAACVMLVTPS